MIKRFLILVLTLVMWVMFIPMSVNGVSNHFISLDKTVYNPNEAIVVTVNGITQQMVDDDAYISIYKKGAAHNQYMSWSRPDAGSSQLNFTAPSELGSYEMRLYNKDYTYTDDTFVMSIPFTVSIEKQGKISLEKDSYQAQQKISVTVTGISQEMVESEAFVSIYKKGARHQDYGTYQYVKAGNSIIELTAPNLNGAFEMRLYGIDHNYSDDSFIMSVPFTLSGAIQERTSNWAKTEVEKAEEVGLIPNILKGSDLTKPITREVFCELALLLYEKTTGKSPAPVSPNPFKDTANPQILKAFKLGITTGTSSNTFSPKVLINREQCAAMLYRALRVIAPEGNYSIAGVKDFPDQKSISAYAVEGTKYMAKLGIIKGNNQGHFMPKATTTAQEASGYGAATREASILMSVRSYEQIQSGTLGTPTGDGSANTTPSNPITPQAPSSNVPKSESEIAGLWMGFINQWAVTGMYTPMKVFMVMYEDGTFYQDMPLEGLEAFDRNKSRNSEEEKAYWGTYTFDNNSRKGTWKRGQNASENIEMDEKGNLKIGSDPYYRCYSVNGLKLEGSWSVYFYLEDLINHPGANKPVITFTNDGKFIDKGLFGENDFLLPEQLENYYVDADKVAPGKGTYEIKDYTLILRYDDGRVRKTSFNLYFGEQKQLSPESIFVYRRELNRVDY